MSRVLVISQLPPPIHGSTVMTKSFLQVLDDLGHEWRLVDRRFSASVADVGKFSIRKCVSGVSMPPRLMSQLIRFRPRTVVFFVTNRKFSFVVDWALSEVLRRFPIRRINYLHTVGFEAIAASNSVFAWMTHRLLGSADWTVCLGPSLASDITSWVDESRIKFIENTVSDLPRELGTRDPINPPLVLYLSNLIPEKGAGTFVDVAITLAAQVPEAQFIVAGATADQAFTDSLTKKIELAGLTDRIELPGAITDQFEKWRLLRDASVLVFPSVYPFEAQPLTILEALSVGTPVVAFDVGGVRDILRHGEDGCLLPIGDETGVLVSTKHLLGSPKNAADERFTMSEFSSKWAHVLEESCGRVRALHSDAGTGGLDD